MKLSHKIREKVLVGLSVLTLPLPLLAWSNCHNATSESWPNRNVGCLNSDMGGSSLIEYYPAVVSKCRDSPNYWAMCKDVFPPDKRRERRYIGQACMSVPYYDTTWVTTGTSTYANIYSC